ncbi:MAG: hypothetical protein WC527_04965 [Candidatus Margulisiibacteriota bacterium]
MGNRIAGLVCALGIAMVFISNGCGVTNSGGSSVTTTFYTETSNTTPVFQPSSASTSSIRPSAVTSLSTEEWGSGNPLYCVYYSLREFISSRDEGVVDRSNLYKLLIDVDSVFSGLSSTASSITSQEVTPPFDKLQKIVCDKAYNDTGGKRSIAMKETASEVNAIITWIWSDVSNKEEYGIATINYNKDTSDITVDMTFSVDYDVSGSTACDYNLRCYVTGNSAANSFQFKYIVGNNTVVAKGISKGAGNYMLFKYEGPGVDQRYIVVEGTADESFFIAQNSTPTAIFTNEAELPATVSAYKDWVVSTEAFSASDMVTDISVLNTGNAKQGTIYINHN